MTFDTLSIFPTLPNLKGQQVFQQTLTKANIGRTHPARVFSCLLHWFRTVSGKVILH